MPTAEQMTAVVHAYVDAFAREDIDSIASLYAENCTLEDPVGSPLVRGRAAVRAFYAHAVSTGAKLKLEGDVRVSANFAAFAFGVYFSDHGMPMHVDVIDTFKFDDDGKIVEMRAFWGPANTHSL